MYFCVHNCTSPSNDYAAVAYSSNQAQLHTHVSVPYVWLGLELLLDIQFGLPMWPEVGVAMQNFSDWTPLSKFLNPPLTFIHSWFYFLLSTCMGCNLWSYKCSEHLHLWWLGKVCARCRVQVVLRHTSFYCACGGLYGTCLTFVWYTLGRIVCMVTQRCSWSNG